MSADLRRDPLTGQEVIIAPGRAKRPGRGPGAGDHEKLPKRDEDCPFCPGNEHLTPPTTLALPADDPSGPWSVRVVPNLYPIVSAERERHHERRGYAATGVHEVVIETPRHDVELADREPGEVALLLAAVHERLRVLEARPKTRQVQVFKNKGRDAGTSLDHPHSQVVALDFVPQLTRSSMRRAERHLREKDRCLLCTVVAEERAQGDRLVFEDEGFVALAPYASTWAGEVSLIPLSHAPSFTLSTDTERERLASCLLGLAARVKAAFDDPPYNLMLHTAPVRRREDAALHWYWQLTPRFIRKAGLEVGSGVQVNPLPPEEAAALLRT